MTRSSPFSRAPSPRSPSTAPLARLSQASATIRREIHLYLESRLRADVTQSLSSSFRAELVSGWQRSRRDHGNPEGELRSSLEGSIPCPPSSYEPARLSVNSILMLGSARPTSSSNWLNSATRSTTTGARSASSGPGSATKPLRARLPARPDWPRAGGS
jgi:hypothetical protein